MAYDTGPFFEQDSGLGESFYGGIGNALSNSASEKPECGNGACLKDLQILVVEDEFLVALEVEEALEHMGCKIVGPFAKLNKAVEAAQRSPLDGAVLDINLNGEMVYPLAELLENLSIPFVFITGYTAADLPERFRAFRRLTKPLDANALRRAFLDIRHKPH
jgi:two-component SAPR family response regulator